MSYVVAGITLTNRGSTMDPSGKQMPVGPPSNSQVLVQFGVFEGSDGAENPGG